MNWKRFFACAIAAYAYSATAQQGDTKIIAQQDDITAIDVSGYTHHIWNWLHTGQPSPQADQFQFSDPTRVGHNAIIVDEALALFSDLYDHRLTNNFDSDTYYSIWDLLRDDADVLEHFMEYTTTHTLRTNTLYHDSATVHRHLELVLGINGTTAACIEPIDYWAEENADRGGVDIVSVMGSDKKKCDSPGDSDTEPSQIPDILRNPVNDFPLRHYPMYIKDGFWPWSKSGFDCDDWADALAEYLKRSLEGSVDDLQIWQFWVTWYGDGHVVTVVRINGLYYVVDAQTGLMRGPYRTRHDAKRGVWEIMRDAYGIEPDNVIWERIDQRAPETRPILETPPWHTDPDRRDDFRRETGLDPDDYIPRGG